MWSRGWRRASPPSSCSPARRVARRRRASPTAPPASSTPSRTWSTSWCSPHRRPRASRAVREPTGPETGCMSHAVPTSPRARAAMLAAGPAAAAALVLMLTGAVQPPDVEGALTRLAESLGAWTYALVAGLAFLETGAFVGLVAPGETAIVLGGVVAAQGEVSLPLIMLAAWVAAALGDLASYALGRRLGRPFLVAHGPRVGVTAPRLERVEGFFDRHGGKAILTGRFAGLVRAVAPFVAGASGL